MDRLVECVPNFSEGRDQAKVQALVAAATGVPGVFLLDQEMDCDHHRAVLTLVGAPEAIQEAAFKVTRLAVELIDLRVHRGGHPRVGATDVVPFVPLRGVTMAECAALARRVGQRIGRELGIPVFLYEQAASRPECTNLEAIRRGGPDGLAERMASDPRWAPDYGPPRLHPTAGATIVGARPPLIAFNVNLDTADPAVAKAIARTVRFSSGGLPHVKAIGVELKSRGIVQVSMNLTNFEVTSIHTAFEAVRREAERAGVSVIGSEIVGLVPQRALVQVAEAFLKLERFDPSQILESRLEGVLVREIAEPPVRFNLSDSVAEFLEAVRAGTPTPGGGSVSALAGALGAGLGVMVSRIEAARDAEADLQLTEVRERLTTLSAQLQEQIQADAESYEAVMQAYRLSKQEPQRRDRIASALDIAARIPLRTAELSLEAARLLSELLPRIKPTMASDVKVGVLMALTAAEGGLENVTTNMKYLGDQRVISELSARVSGLKQSLVDLRTL